MRTNKREIAFYAEDGGGTCNELVLDFYNRYYEYYYETREKTLYGKHFGIPEIKISKRELCRLFDIIQPLYRGEECMEIPSYGNERENGNGGKPYIDSETLWKALKRELSEREINKISSFDYFYEEGDYYDYQLICTEINNCIKGKISFDDFMDWLAVMMHCLMSNDIKNRNIRFEYEQLADMIDGFLFVEYDPMDYDYLSNRRKRRICLGLLAQVKWINHKIEDLRRGQETDFTTNDVVTYVSYSFSLDDGNTNVYRICVADNKRRRINYMYAKDVEYRGNINYTFLSEADFDALTDKYFTGYSLDLTMPVYYAVVKTAR